MGGPWVLGDIPSEIGAPEGVDQIQPHCFVLFFLSLLSDFPMLVPAYSQEPAPHRPDKGATRSHL